ncbi:MAG: DUF1573 domain-containing protein, partial [Planctomycetota bacterium]
MFRTMQILSASIALLALAPHATAAVAPEKTQASGVVAVPAVVDLGDLRAGSVHTERIWLVNTGLDAVAIESSRGSCGCTRAAGFAPRDLAPGEAYP